MAAGTVVAQSSERYVAVTSGYALLWKGILQKGKLFGTSHVTAKNAQVRQSIFGLRRQVFSSWFMLTVS